VQNPDDLVARYGADTLRLYEMFLGPVEQAKPWDTNGIEGVFRFLKKFWKLFESSTDTPATKPQLKILHQTIKKITDDIERFSFNTSVSTFMICVNDLSALGSVSRQVIEPIAILLAPFAPHIAEEVYSQLGHDTSVYDAQWPEYDPAMLVQDTFTYPVSFNGKMRLTLELPNGISQQDAVAAVMADKLAQKWLDGKQPKRVVFVPNKIINIVL
jgi:leucyl-tRNA synthetase